MNKVILDKNIHEMCFHVWASEYAEALPAARYVHEILGYGVEGLKLADSSPELYQAHLIAKLVIEVNRCSDATCTYSITERGRAALR